MIIWSAEKLLFFFLRALSLNCRKNILQFLDPERDISILKGTLKPGDIIHYVFDRHSTTNISENLYRLLPTVSPMKNQHHRRCAIVGNSGILLNSSCGSEIDAHDFVIRWSFCFYMFLLKDVALIQVSPVKEILKDASLKAAAETHLHISLIFLFFCWEFA